MEEARVHALDYLRVFRRRKRWLLVPLVASIVVGALLAKFLPKEYRSSATLAVAAPIVSPDLVRQSVPLNNQERLRALEQQLMSAQILGRVLREERIGDGTLSEARAIALRRSIKFSVPDPVVATNELRRLDTFVVSYSDNDPARAQRMANRLVNTFVDENSKARTEQAEDTAMFIEAQLDQSQTRLNQLEERLRQAKEAHIGLLPEQMQANLQTLSGLRQQHETTGSALRTEQDRLSLIVRQLEGLQQGSSNVVILSRPGDPQGQTPETRVMALERELANARALWTDRHPEVQRLEGELQSARAAAAADRQRPAEARAAELRLDPTYRQLIADQQLAQMRIKELQRAEAEARRQIGIYQARVEGAPMVEQKLAAVQREYDLEKQQYGDLSTKLHSATMAENVERNRGGEQFTVLYAASFPTEPVSPVTWRVMLLSVLAGIALGGAAIFLREYLDRSVHDVHDFKDEFDVPVLGEVSRIGAM